MKVNIYCAALCVAVLSGASGCAHSEVPKAQVNVGAAGTAGAEATENGAGAASGLQSTEVEEPRGNEPPDSGQEGVDPVIGAEAWREALGTLELGLSAEQVLEQLKEPASKTPPVEWGADGLWHSTWNYPALGLELDMAADVEHGHPVLLHISASAGCTMKTDRGIGIGSPRVDVEKAYPKEGWDPDFTDDDTIIFGSVFGGILFQFDGDKVSVISIGAFAE